MKLKIIIPIIVIVVALSAFLVFKKPSPKTDTGTNSPSSQVVTPSSATEGSGACEVTLKTAYQSVTAMNAAPAGGQDVRSNYWHVTFNDKTVVWQKADKLEAGTYSCHGANIEATINGETKTGTYNSDTKTLVFDGQDYKIPNQ